MNKSKGLHPRNYHNKRYDFEALIDSHPKLKEYVITNKYKDRTIDFSDQISVMVLNQALLTHFYHIKSWSIPKGHLCPPIPGRADYIHYLSDILSSKDPLKGLDIGTGTGCIYPLLGVSLYNYTFVATDTNLDAINSSEKIIASNPHLENKIELRLQENPKNIFSNIIKDKDRFDFTVCNPPFHSSEKEALIGSRRKRENLINNKLKNGHDSNSVKNELNFGGIANELWCPGGELQFIGTMISESVLYKKNIKLFTALVSKKESLNTLTAKLNSVKAQEIQVIEMQHGQKISHILVWSF
jgi:23S rRNA (adenine1618-N6)-methyltransferase